MLVKESTAKVNTAPGAISGRNAGKFHLHLPCCIYHANYDYYSHRGCIFFLKESKNNHPHYRIIY